MTHNKNHPTSKNNLEVPITIEELLRRKTLPDQGEIDSDHLPKNIEDATTAVERAIKDL